MTKFILSLFAFALIFTFARANENNVTRKPNSDFTQEYQSLLKKNEVEKAEKDRRWAEHQRYLELIDKGGD
ncbi:MAG: hypothetical protein VX642_14790 [Bdellovibrionota bacterium]|nr:hypothetical protein [Bdellovibrionota bacterium]